MPMPKSTDMALESVAPRRDHPSREPADERYARHVALAGFGAAGQAALAGSRVLVVGAGGLGSPVLAYLAAAGVGVLGVVDDDVVETSNLQRQVIHRDDAVGSAKASSAANFVIGLNPEVEVEVHPVRLDVAQALDILPGYDLVVDGTDTFESRYLLNDACVALGIPLVWASISEYSGQLGVVAPQEGGPCYRCLFPQQPEVGTVLTCAEGGVLGVLPGIVGSMQALEVIKVLTGVGEALTSGVLLYDALTAHSSVLEVHRDPACLVCGEGASSVVPWLSPGLGSGAVAVNEVGQDVLVGAAVVLDVREPDEVAQRPWAGAWVWPWSSWDVEVIRTVVAAVAEAEGPVVTVCASGARSRAAVERLLAAGAPAGSVVSLRGGLGALGGDIASKRRTADG